MPNKFDFGKGRQNAFETVGLQPPAPGEGFNLPAQFGADLSKFLPMILQNPAFRSQLSGINAGVNAAQSGLASQLGRSGAQQTGLGRTAAGLAQGAGGFARGEALGQAGQQAQQLTLQTLLSRLGLLPQVLNTAVKATEKTPGVGGQIAKALASAGFKALATFLLPGAAPAAAAATAGTDFFGTQDNFNTGNA